MLVAAALLLGPIRADRIPIPAVTALQDPHALQGAAIEVLLLAVVLQVLVDPQALAAPLEAHAVALAVVQEEVDNNRS